MHACDKCGLVRKCHSITVHRENSFPRDFLCCEDCTAIIIRTIIGGRSKWENVKTAVQT